MVAFNIMNVTTTYNVGDRLYYIEDGAVYQNEVVKVHIESTKSNPTPDIRYFFSSNSRMKRENEVASTLEELIRIVPVIKL